MHGRLTWHSSSRTAGPMHGGQDGWPSRPSSEQGLEGEERKSRGGLQEYKDPGAEAACKACGTAWSHGLGGAGRQGSTEAAGLVGTLRFLSDRAVGGIAKERKGQGWNFSKISVSVAERGREAGIRLCCEPGQLGKRGRKRWPQVSGSECWADGWAEPMFQRGLAQVTLRASGHLVPSTGQT